MVWLLVFFVKVDLVDEEDKEVLVDRVDIVILDKRFVFRVVCGRGWKEMVGDIGL